jgi:hypothetical protein
MSILEVIECDTIPTELKERSEHNSDEAVAAVLTQTFHYMIQCGLEYSYITTGEAFVFLRIKEEDPTTLYYHRCSSMFGTVTNPLSSRMLSKTPKHHF